jgi:transcriptional regulator with GAF, ATPase, and Fis domain
MTNTTAPRKDRKRTENRVAEWRIYQILTNGRPVTAPRGKPIAAGRTSLGRDESCGICIVGDESVSRHHATLILQSNRLYIKDSGKHGTIVKGKQGPALLNGSEAELHDGDLVMLSDTGFAMRHEEPDPEVQPDPLALGVGPAWRTALRDLSAVAPSGRPVLLVGETGTGKELAAHFIHRKSGHSKGPFIAVNCAEIQSTLAETALFGHVRGAFSNAIASSKGHFQAAEGGTLFLDEIGELPIEVQSKLLRVLQDGMIQVVGAPTRQRSNVRVVAATNVDLEAATEDERFRYDLFQRFAHQIELPPLRERIEDLYMLAEHLYREEIRGRSDRGSFEIDAELAMAMSLYAWPGNVRELGNAIAKLIAKDRPPYVLDDLPESTRKRWLAAATSARPRLSLSADRERIIELIKERTTQEELADMLGVKRRSMIRALTAAGIEHPWSKE